MVTLAQGSAWVMLTRRFVEYCPMGGDNFPRTVLMYYTNFISSPEGYFHTVIFNAEEFRSTALGHGLHCIAWDTPLKQHPISLTIKDFEKMVKSKAPFARKFANDDPVLDKIDKELLGRSNRFTSGAWCIGSSENGADPCSVRGNYWCSGQVLAPRGCKNYFRVCCLKIFENSSVHNSGILFKPKCTFAVFIDHNKADIE